MSISETDPIWPRCASMSNRPAMLLWISIKVNGKSRFRFFLALPIFVALALADMLDDMGALAAVFFPRISIKTAGNRERTVSSMIHTVTGTLFDFLWEFIFVTGPLDLVDVDVQNKRGTVKVKVATR